MSMASPEIQELARQLLAFEAVESQAPNAPIEATVRVIDELRTRLVRLAGVDGFRSLLSRSLALAKMEAPCLDAVRISANGSIEGFDEIGQGLEATGHVGRVLVAQLLGLMVTFIGESLTLRLVRDSWPEASMKEVGLQTEEKP